MLPRMCLVMCSMYIFFMDKVLELLSGGSVINGAYPVYFLLEDPFNRAGAQTFPVVSLWDTAGLSSVTLWGTAGLCPALTSPASLWGAQQVSGMS